MADGKSTRTYEEGEIRKRLASDLPQWRFEDGALTRSYRTSGWKGTMLAAGAVAHLAEVAWHHPELRLEYPRLTVRLNTHDANGITDKDFALARKIEEVIGWRPGEEGGGLEGVPMDPGYLLPG